MKIRLGPLVAYAFGIGAILIGLLFALVSLGSGLLLALAGVLALPVVRRQLAMRANLEFSRWAVVGIVAILTVASTGVLVATVGTGPGFQQAENPWSDETRTSTDAGETVTVTATLEDGEYGVWRLSPSWPVEFSYSFRVVKGDAVSIFVADRVEYDRYRDEQVYSVYTALSRAGGADGASMTLAPGKYVLVVDNSKYSTADVAGPVTVELTLTVKVAG